MLAPLLRAALGLSTAAGLLPAQTDAAYDGEPIRYSSRTPDDPVARLIQALRTGSRELPHAGDKGYLPALLRALDIPVATQGLVFSKTSFQNDRISPRSPRALYFGDEVYVGYVPGGEVLEITAMDPQLGPIFYTLDQRPAATPQFVRRTNECLNCHGSTRTHDWPGNLVRSVYADPAGHPRTDTGSFLTTHDSPFAERWGGWYVTGRHGDLRHMGNNTVAADASPARLDLERGANVEDLDGRFPKDNYLSPHSDIVALMVLEHQTHMHNLLARAKYVVQRALYLQRETNRALGVPLDRMSPATERVIQRSADEILDYLMFKNEPRLPSPVVGTSDFADTFAKRGRRDPQGRSLRDLDLQTRLFRYPCSYLIYSPCFDALPRPVLDAVYHKLRRILTGKASRRAWSVTRAQRTAILEILLATKDGLPDSWRRRR